MINFLTSNKKKANDFKTFGFGVEEFSSEIPEIKSPIVQEVALYKAKDTGLNNIVVEDTSLTVNGLDFFGTDIKHTYDEIKTNSNYEGFDVSWMVCLCMKKDDFFYLATGELVGKLSYPGVTDGYHFENILTVEKDGKHVFFPKLSKEEQNELSPRFLAVKKLAHAVKTNDYSQLLKIDAKNVKDWEGEYQVETTKSKPAFR